MNGFNPYISDADSAEILDIGLISIIIPAYNSAKYIIPILDDLASQTYKSLEIIIAYDTKSTDNTLDILKSYVKRLRLYIDEDNDESVGAARNRGAKLAHGDFIIFLDADDRIIPNYISDLANVFAKNPSLDLVYGEYIVAKSSEITEKYVQAENSQYGFSLHPNTDVLEMWCNGKLGGFSWRWLVKRDYFITHNIHYPNYSRMEDDSYVLQLITNTEMIGHSNKQGYVYIQHPTSLSHNLPPLSQRIKDYKRRNADVSHILSIKYPQYYSQFKKHIFHVIKDKLKERIHKTNTSESLRN